MSYLLDTNVLSEIVRPKPDPGVREWLEQTPDDTLYVSVLTIGELRRRVERLGDPVRREKLRLWLEHELPGWFGDRVLDVDLAVADRWGRLSADVRRPLPTLDSLIAATALHHGLRLVTRNVKDFELPELEVVNPWSQP